MNWLETIYEPGLEWLRAHRDLGPRFLLAVATLVVGLYLIRVVVRFLQKLFQKTESHDKTFQTFVGSLIFWSLRVALFISVAAMLGVDTTSFITVLGAAGLAVGLALQGSLANLAGGLLLMLLKPYRVGDFVEMQGYKGTVEAIQIFNTTLIDAGNRTVFLPNGPIVNGPIVNFTMQGVLRIALEVRLDYSANLGHAKRVLLDLLESHPKILADPAPMVAVKDLTESAALMAVHAWAPEADYWPLFYELQELVIERLKVENLSMPFPRMDVRLTQE